VSFLERWLEDPVAFSRLRRCFYAGLVAVLIAEIALPLVFAGDHAHFSFESFPGWGSIYGFVSCSAIIVVSKLLGKAWLMRREDHYGS
jgi:hypothetical protein